MLVGRIWVEGVGPVLVRVTDPHLFDLSGVAATASELLEMADPAGSVREYGGGVVLEAMALGVLVTGPRLARGVNLGT